MLSSGQGGTRWALGQSLPPSQPRNYTDPRAYSRLLLLAYTSGLQIWDCTNLGSVSEILNLRSSPAPVPSAQNITINVLNTDTTIPEALDISGVNHVLNLPRVEDGPAEWGRVLRAAVLPGPSSERARRADPFKRERPVIGVV